jgi:hypothetical protein
MSTGHLARDRRSRWFFRSPKMNGSPAVQASVSPVQRSRFQLLKTACITSTHSPELIKRITDVLDEIIPSMAVDEQTPALITHIARCVLKLHDIIGGRVSRKRRDLERVRSCGTNINFHHQLRNIHEFSPKGHLATSSLPNLRN